MGPAPTGPIVGHSELDWVKMGINLAGGLAIFLFGMELMTDALKAVAGDRMKRILATMTTNRVTGVISGALITATIQSSSVTTVLVVGFVSAGVLSLTQSIGIIFGAEIGTTITAQVIAFNVTKYALVMVAAGFLMSVISRNNNVRQYGKILLGLGLVFYGMTVMSGAMKPLRSYQPFIDLMIEVQNPFLAIAITAFFTALIQSSSATTGIIIVMASQGLIPLHTGIALAFGANIGTCVTALLAAIGKPREAVRAALVHITFNTTGVLIWVNFIGPMTELITSISPVSEGLEGAARLAADTPRQIANAHTMFNLGNTLMFLPFVGLMAKLMMIIVPEKKVAVKESAKDIPTTDDAPGEIQKPIRLSRGLVRTPSLAMNMLRIKIARRMGHPIQEMLQEVIPAIIEGDEATLRRVEERDSDVDESYARIVTYLGQIGSHTETKTQMQEFTSLVSIANDLEDLGDVIEKSLVHLGREVIRKELPFDDETRDLLGRFHEELSRCLEDSLASVLYQDSAAANRVARQYPAIRELSDEAATLESRRLASDHEDRVAMHAITMEIYDKMRWIYFRSRRISALAGGPEVEA
ncbi:MAG: Na/Pi cotransporter family protein [Magnetococcales bacterium]|nr:Na/Pi cotransporter family protein [Magnetococcales bacterium]